MRARVADVLAVAYFHAMRYRPDDPTWDERDRFLLSIGHYAIALYAVATLVRGERWLSLLRAEGATPSRADAQGLNAVGYAANNVLPARAGDAVRVFLMAPLASMSKKAVLGTLLAERLLDIAVILTLFVVVGYGLLGEAGAGEAGWILLATALFAVAGAVAVVVIRRNERMHQFMAPIGVRHLTVGAWLVGMLRGFVIFVLLEREDLRDRFKV